MGGFTLIVFVDLFVFLLICIFYFLEIAEYLDEAMLIPTNTSVVVRRIPGLPRLPIVIQPE